MVKIIYWFTLEVGVGCWGASTKLYHIYGPLQNFTSFTALQRTLPLPSQVHSEIRSAQGGRTYHVLLNRATRLPPFINEWLGWGEGFQTHCWSNYLLSPLRGQQNSDSQWLVGLNMLITHIQAAKFKRRRKKKEKKITRKFGFVCFVCLSLLPWALKIVFFEIRTSGGVNIGVRNFHIFLGNFDP